jgi:hypothetical protein
MRCRESITSRYSKKEVDLIIGFFAKANAARRNLG